MNLRDLWDNIKQTDICITGILKGEKTEQEVEIIFEEIITENFPNLGKENRLSDPGSSQSAKQDDPKRPTPRYIIIKYQKLKTRRES